jgi:hypothetical protein
MSRRTPAIVLVLTVLVLPVRASGRRADAVSAPALAKATAGKEKGGPAAQAQTAPSTTLRKATDDLERRFASDVRPFIESYCAGCHGGASPAAQFDLRSTTTVDDVRRDQARWGLVLDKLEANQMPPAQARQPSPESRQLAVAWLDEFRQTEARTNAGDPGVVLARRLSNAEYNYTIRDLTGVDIRPAREFPVDPANPAGFDNSGESLAMSPALLTKYLQAAQEVANHLVLKPSGFAFAPHPMLVETDRDKYCVNQIIEFYRAKSVDLADYFEAAWHRKYRPSAKAKAGVSAKYVATVLAALENTKETVGPLATLQSRWRAVPTGADAASVRRSAEQMRDFVVQLRQKIQVTHTELSIEGLGDDAQPFLMWRNRQYATNRRNYDRSSLKTEGQASDPELQVPAAERERYEAAFARFASLFPDAFYVSERGRYFPDTTRDVGRHLSAGFHNLMGYFRDDQPLYDLILDQKEQAELDALWRELDFIASATSRTYVQFYLSESGAARKAAADAIEGRGEAGTDVIAAPMIQKVAASYL